MPWRGRELPKSQTLWHYSSQAVALYPLWLIVVISVRQSTVATISGLHCRALVMVVEHKADSLIANWSGRNGQRDWCTEQSPRLSSLWLSASSSAYHGLLIITVITPYLQSPARQKCQRTEAERGNYWHADASGVMLLRSMQNTRRS